MTSAVTSMPWALAQRTTSTEPAVETWATWTRLPVCRASMTSRATMVSSAMPGQPGRPSRPESSPSWQQALGPARWGSCACWETTPPKARTYSSARRMTRGVVDALAVVGEHADPGPAAVHQPQLGELLAGQALGDRADRLDVDQTGGPPEVEDPLGGLGGVGDRAGVRHGEDRGEPAHGRRRRAGGDGLGVLAPGLAQVGVQVDQPGQGDQPVGVEHLGALRGADGADLGDDAVPDEQVLGSGPERGRPP